MLLDGFAYLVGVVSVALLVVAYLVVQAVRLELDVLEGEPLVHDVQPDHLVQKCAVVQGRQRGWVFPGLIGGGEQSEVLHFAQTTKETRVNLVGQHLLELVQRSIFSVLEKQSLVLQGQFLFSMAIIPVRYIFLSLIHILSNKSYKYYSAI